MIVVCCYDKEKYYNLQITARTVYLLEQQFKQTIIMYYDTIQGSKLMLDQGEYKIDRTSKFSV